MTHLLDLGYCSIQIAVSAKSGFRFLLIIFKCCFFMNHSMHKTEKHVVFFPITLVKQPIFLKTTCKYFEKRCRKT